jgi:hypothetical protein
MYLHIGGLERNLALNERYMEAFSVIVNWE